MQQVDLFKFQPCKGNSPHPCFWLFSAFKMVDRAQAQKPLNKTAKTFQESWSILSLDNQVVSIMPIITWFDQDSRAVPPDVKFVHSESCFMRDQIKFGTHVWLIRIPRHFELKPIFLGFYFQSFTIGYFELYFVSPEGSK